jgi:hypothetical protein
MAVSAGPDLPFFTSVLAIGELAQNLAYGWGMGGHAAGGAIWRTRTYHPGRLPGMAIGPHGAAIVHTLALTTWGAGHAAALWHSAQLMAVDEPGEVLSAWTQDHLADSVIVGIPRGFLPVTFRRLGRMPAPCRPLIHAGALLLGGFCPPPWNQFSSTAARST